MRRSIITLALFVMGLLSLPAQSAIFGADDRKLITPTSQDAHLADSIAVGVLYTIISKDQTGLFKIETDSISDMLCEDEKFVEQDSVPYACSGFLVGPDLLVTAGHCMSNSNQEVRNETGLYCEAYNSWVFNHTVDAQGLSRSQRIQANDHYTCKQIIYAILEDKPPYRDFALIQLDRPVVGRQPLKLSTSSPQKNEKLKMIGHPMGLPAVLARNAKIFQDDLSKPFFETNLDALDGNSGSPVFNKSNEVVGILTSGTPASWWKDPAGRCERPNRCHENGFNCKEPAPKNERASSTVQKIHLILEKIKEFEKTR